MYTIIFLLIACCSLIFWGIWGPVYDWFTGPRLVTLFALGAMFAQALAAEGNKYATYMTKGCSILAFILGGHLLAPYFWAGRIHNLIIFVLFYLTGALVWWLLLTILRSKVKFTLSFKALCTLPLVLLVGSICSAKVSYGNFIAPALLCMVYAVAGGALIHEGVQKASRWLYNCGLGIYCLLLAAASVTFLFALPGRFQQGLLIFLLVFLNVIFAQIKEAPKK